MISGITNLAKISWYYIENVCPSSYLQSSISFHYQHVHFVALAANKKYHHQIMILKKRRSNSLSSMTYLTITNQKSEWNYDNDKNNRSQSFGSNNKLVCCSIKIKNYSFDLHGPMWPGGEFFLQVFERFFHVYNGCNSNYWNLIYLLPFWPF